jgi:outer membrane protein insertion porin family
LGYNLGYTDRNAGQINIANYSTTVANAGMDFGIPLNEFDQLRFGIDLKHTRLKQGTNTSNEIQQFVNDNGNKYLTLAPSIGWTHDTLNRAIFPNKGGQQRLSALATLPGISDLDYYKISYKHQEYFSLSSDFTFRLLADIGYGDGYGKTHGLPFFENYYGGGTGSVRGFRNNTLGPRDTPVTSTRQHLPFGGATKIVGSAELFFPVPFLPETKSVRLGAFFDAGRIQNGFGFDNMKYSAGEWLSPFGALSVSAAVPLNAKPFNASTGAGDQKQLFQFNFGQNF